MPGEDVYCEAKAPDITADVVYIDILPAGVLPVPQGDWAGVLAEKGDALGAGHQINFPVRRGRGTRSSR
ncbi:MAG TPA: hypothetical protein VLA19_04805, partial [Herpetosiphonaceae bacterium]|nr:hypothetical protein [Herpetosiphonaceae bacterium]